MDPDETRLITMESTGGLSRSCKRNGSTRNAASTVRVYSTASLGVHCRKEMVGSGNPIVNAKRHPTGRVDSLESVGVHCEKDTQPVAGSTAG
jgi:hypothetical protein